MFSAETNETQSLSVMEGDSVTLHTDVTEIHDDDEIMWNFGSEISPIAQINRASGIFSTSDGPEIHDGDEIMWNFGAEMSLIAQINRASRIFSTSDGPEIHDGDEIMWNFGAEMSLIAQINRASGIFFTHTDERFRDRLKLDDKTGSLTITNITTKHAGLYEVKILAAKRSSKTFNLSVYGGYHLPHS